MVDAIQGLGALPIDVSKLEIDVLAADAHKWLLGPEVCTVFYVAQEAWERLPPAFGGWWNMKTEEGEAGYLGHPMDLYRSARRYEPGSLPTAQIAGLAAALDLLEEAGPETVRARILAVNEVLLRGFSERGWKIASPEPLASGILAAVPPGGDPKRYAKELEARGIIVAPREGAVRFSPHFYNDAEEVGRIFGAVDEIR